MAPPVRSMTGFGRAEAALEVGALLVEIKSVNSRHLDVRVRVPRELSAHEPGLRELASGYFLRGQIELTVRLPTDAPPVSEVEVDLAAARHYAEAAERLSSELPASQPLTLSALLQLPGGARLREPKLENASRMALGA